MASDPVKLRDELGLLAILLAELRELDVRDHLDAAPKPATRGRRGRTSRGRHWGRPASRSARADGSAPKPTTSSSTRVSATPTCPGPSSTRLTGTTGTPRMTAACPAIWVLTSTSGHPAGKPAERGPRGSGKRDSATLAVREPTAKRSKCALPVFQPTSHPWDE